MGEDRGAEVLLLPVCAGRLGDAVDEFVVLVDAEDAVRREALDRERPGKDISIGRVVEAPPITISALPTRPDMFGLTVTSSGGGTVSLDPPPTDPADPQYADETEVTLRATWDAATHRFIGWGDDCDGRAATDPTCVLIVDGHKTVTATFGPAQHTLTVAVHGGGGNRGISLGTGAHVYDHGTTVQIAAHWDDSTHMFAWSGACRNSDTMCAFTMNGPRTLTATFTSRGGPPQCTLQVDADPRFWAQSVSGDWTGDCDASTSRTATVVPHTGFTISSWSEPGCNGNSCMVTMGIDRDVTAYLSCVGNRTLTTTPPPRTGGTITPATGPQPCDGTVTVTATPATTPAPGYRVGAWSGSGSDLCVEGQDRCTVQMGGFARSVTVDFVPQCTLVVNGGTGDGTVDCGDRLTATATLPTEHYTFDDWTGGNCGTSNPCTVTVGTAGGRPETETVTANFTAPLPQVTITGSTIPVTEGQPAQFTVSRTGSTASALNVSVDVTETGDVLGTPLPSSVTIDAGSSTATLPVDTVNDTTDEEHSSVMVEVLRGSDYIPGVDNSGVSTVADDDLTVRIAGRRVADGRTEFALQQRGADGEWGDRQLPTIRFLPADADVDVWKVTRPPLTVSEPGTSGSAEVVITARPRDDGRVEVGLRQRVGGQDGERQLPTGRFIPSDSRVDFWRPSTSLTVTAIPDTSASRTESDDLDDEQRMEPARAGDEALPEGAEGGQMTAQ